MKITRLALDFAEKNGTNNKVFIDDKSPDQPITWNMNITLYVLTDAKTTSNSIKTTWANWISTTDIDELNSAVTGEHWIASGSKLFLTKLSEPINIRNVTGDFIIEKAANNDVYPVPAYTTASFWLVNLVAIFLVILASLISPFGVVFVVFVLLQLRVIKTRKWVFRLGTAYEIFTCVMLILILITVLVILVSTENLGKLVLEEGFLGIMLGLLMVFIAAVFGVVKMIQRDRKMFGNKPAVN
jgi:hypothetical protein